MSFILVKVTTNVVLTHYNGERGKKTDVRLSHQNTYFRSPSRPSDRTLNVLIMYHVRSGEERHSIFVEHKKVDVLTQFSMRGLFQFLRIF